MANPTVRGWIKYALFRSDTKSLCLPAEIVGSGLSLAVVNLVDAADKAYWHYNPEKNNTKIPDYRSEDAESWRHLYMQVLACRLKERPHRGLRNKDEDIDDALDFIGVSRREFEMLKPTLLYGSSKKGGKGQMASDTPRHS